jgi:hypothetical protein
MAGSDLVAAVSQLELNGVPVYINPAIGPSGTVHAQRLGIALECIVVDSLETFYDLVSTQTLEVKWR